LVSKPEVTDLYAKRFTLAQRTAFVANLPRASETHSEADKVAINLDAQLYLIIEGICDQNAEPVFTIDDKESLKDEDASVIDELSKHVMTTNGMNVGAKDEAEKK
ncbi:MAG: hypothetical protein ING73_17160, partial [Rhodocyclaceae bacterium]|nr:hypothetical protein [Rhodocyclaceae bacterium]